MKKFFTILAIAFVSFNFVSCREDDAASEMEVSTMTKQNTANKITDSTSTDSIKVNNAAQNAVDPPKDPPKDRTHW